MSKDEGMVNRPLAPHLDRDPVTIQGKILIKCIEQRLQKLPFKLIDNRELWLFDREEKRPIALLASQNPDTKPLSPEPKYWKSCLGANGMASQYRYPEAGILEQLIERTASSNICRYWVNRADDGSGILEAGGGIMQTGKFPSYLISEDWLNNEQVSLVSGYIAWTAPTLLTLQHLNNDERDRLEGYLHVQAISVEHHWRLYPEIMDEKKT